VGGHRGRRCGATLIALLLCGIAAAPAARAVPVETVMQDDALVLERSTPETIDALRTMRDLGVDRVRVTADWQELAPAGWSKHAPRRFDPASPAAYPSPDWTYWDSPVRRLDRAIRVADALGMKTMIDLGFWAPLWAAQDRAGSAHGVTRPDPRLYAQFAAAMAARYSGSFRQAWMQSPLPRVDVFTLWNEPNLPTFLRPQFRRGIAASADWYRQMVQAAYAAIKRVRPNATVLIGATSAGGNDAGGAGTATAPIVFIRRLACVDARLRPLRDRGCRHFRRLPGDGFAHHPYSLDSLPEQPSAARGSVGLGDIDRLSALLGRLAARGRVSRAAAQNLWLTEFGYETDRPVHGKPWTPDAQAALLGRAEYVARQNPHVRSFPQFLLRDIRTAAARASARRGARERAFGSWQSGLMFENGIPKPAAESFRLTLLPLWSPGASRRAGGTLTLWGHVRPARSPVSVRIERLDDVGWTAIATAPAAGGTPADEFETAGDGVFDRRIEAGAAPLAEYRLAWLSPDGWQAGPAERVQLPLQR
jgi:hypothetical protein